jgi:hypothetical protein
MSTCLKSLALVLPLACETRGVLRVTPSDTSPSATSQSILQRSVDGLSSRTPLSRLSDFEHGLATSAGMPNTSGLMADDRGRKVLGYLVRCALAVGDTLDKQDQNGTSYSFEGQFGLAPQFKHLACDRACQEILSACILAHVNIASSTLHIPIWLTSPDSAIGWSENPAFGVDEGTFFGNVWSDDTNGGGYACVGPGAATDRVPGRLGIAPGDGPIYSELTLAKEFRNADEVRSGTCATCSRSASHGIAACSLGGTTYAHPITVWRSRTYPAKDASLKDAAPIDCATCWPPQRVGFLTPGSKVSFRGVKAVRDGTNRLLVFYADGDAVPQKRTVIVSVNGGPEVAKAFASCGVTWTTPCQVGMSLDGFTASDANTVTISTPGPTPGPDIVLIELVPLD